MKTYKITEDQINAFFNYMKKQPWEEVNQGITILKTLPLIEEEEKPEEEK